MHTFYEKQIHERASEEEEAVTESVEKTDKVAQDEVDNLKTPESIIKETSINNTSPPSILKTPKKNDDFVFKTPIKTASGALTTPLKTTPLKLAPSVDDCSASGSLTTPQKALLLSPSTPVTR